MRRDRLTFAMMIGVPIMQLMLFGYAINSDPKHLPTAVQIADHGPFAPQPRARRCENSGYFRDRARRPRARPRPTGCSRRGEVQFVRHDPDRTSAATLMRGERPAMLVEADATDPAATGNALAALADDRPHARSTTISTGPLAELRARAAAVRAARPPPLQPGGHHAATTSCRA